MPFDGTGNYTRSNGSYAGTTLWQQKAGSGNATIDAAEHDAEMNDVATALSSCLTKTGVTQPTANLPMNGFKHTGCANATNSNEYATYGQLTSAVPTGSILLWPSSSVPTSWLLCDGSAVSRATYAALFAVIGTLYGAGDGSTTFNLPNLVGRFPLGKTAAGTGSTLGGTGGAIDHTHTVPAHYHNANSAGANIATTFNGRPDDATSTGSWYPSVEQTTQGVQTATLAITGLVGLVTGGVNGDAAMTSGAQNPPFMALNYIIKS